MSRIDICQLQEPIVQAIDLFEEDSVLYSSDIERIASSWASIFYFREKQEAVDHFKNQLYEVWLDRLRPDLDEHDMQVVTRKIGLIAAQACFNLGKELNEEMSVSDVYEISDEIKRSIVAIGHKPEFHSCFDEEEDQTKLRLFQFLLDEIPPLDISERDKLIRALLWKKNPEMLETAREGVRETLQDLFFWAEQDPAHTGSYPKLPIEATIGNMLAIYTFLDPQQDEIIIVPQKVDGSWQNIPYSVEKIQMTPDFLGSPMYAFGLSPVEKNKGFPPLLLFKGTTYPTDEGAFLSILSDLNPFASVGAYAFSMGRENIKNWMDRVIEDDAKVRVFGASLGGSLSLQAGIDFSSYIEEVHAFSPPALFNRDIKKWEDIPVESRPRVFVYCNEGDVIPHFGSSWGKDWTVVSVIASQSYNPFLSHCRVFAADDVIMLDSNIEKDHESFSRGLLSTIQLVASIPIFCFLAFIFALYLAFKKILGQ